MARQDSPEAKEMKSDLKHFRAIGQHFWQLDMVAREFVLSMLSRHIKENMPPGASPVKVNKHERTSRSSAAHR